MEGLRWLTFDMSGGTKAQRALPGAGVSKVLASAFRWLAGRPRAPRNPVARVRSGGQGRN